MRMRACVRVKLKDIELNFFSVDGKKCLVHFYRHICCQIPSENQTVEKCLSISLTFLRAKPESAVALANVNDFAES